MSSSDPSASHQPSTNATLKAGLTALKQGDYPTAISLLERCANFSPNQVAIPTPNTPTSLQAQIGLVTAYKRQGLTEQAIALCQTLTQTPNPQAKAWADKTLASFIQRYPQLVASTELQPATSAASEAPSTISDASGAGFVPLDAISIRKSSRTSKLRPQTTSGSQPRSPQPAPDDTSTPPTGVAQEVLFESTNPVLAASTAATEPHEWKQAGRAQKWQPLSKLKLTRLGLLQAGSAIAFLAFALFVLRFSMRATNWLLVKLPFVQPIQLLYRNPTVIFIVVVGLMLASLPWLMDALLKFLYGLKPLSTATLATYSPEATKVLNRLPRQKQIPTPALRLLPTAAPIALTYGSLPRFARIAVSQGLLEQLADDEIAALYAGEIAHIAHWDFAVMSLAVLLLQVPYTLYWQVATWGDRLEARRKQAQRQNTALFYLFTVLVYIIAAFSSLNYGVYWLLRWPLLWLSRQRLYYSDRLAAEFTGNPNGLTRALLKTAIGVAQDVQQQQQTSYVLEGFNFLAPLDYKTALTVGSFYPAVSFEALLEWDRTNPHRHWLNLNQSHSLLGNRLQLLSSYARHWRLDSELNFANSAQAPTPKLTWQQWLTRYGQRLALQGAPFWGLGLGVAIGLGIWLIAAIGEFLGLWNLFWLVGDWAVLIGCLPLGLSLGIFVRINPFFPDITPVTLRATSPLPTLVANSALLPIDSKPVQLQGKVLGRTGLANWLSQSLILQTDTGLLPLHHTSAVGPLGAFWARSPQPRDLVHQAVTAKGWFHRGATSWIDLETLRTSSGKISISRHPIWSTLLAGVAACVGTYILLFIGGY
ncbi:MULTISPECIES: M48 family metalloprotease [Trichocoleus]|uniref:M48 family metalloprotease n=1 Tax=Trichocoleus desertorum GB2-A4 TaxID=2933944 RepID=A0ABV0JCV2_9CYAN|nr:M48 family metalloprotease [Trichocoleus sp. FACHB-46]MBD1860889.1 M48 family metalloprotease [Trichocoleus sp. FACHB-46]